MNILDDLNPSQQEAVLYCDGPSLIVAGAGSGKTRVLTYKIAYLLEQGLQPWRILALTFTNKAAREMKERIARLVGEEQARDIQMGTFHSVFARILRREAERIGYQSNFTIYDESDARALIKRIVKELQLDEKAYKPAEVHKQISRAKDNLLTADDYAKDGYCAEQDMRKQMPAVADIYTAYEAHCRQANAMDFDDLLLLTHKLFADHEDVRRSYAERFQYVLIDEYQDTNAAQQAVILQLARECPRVCAVGDDYQSIYAFRGAKIDNILDFQKKFSTARVFKLERNYRSTQLIVEAANSLMQKNERQIRKRVYSEEEKGERVSYHKAYSDKDEAAFVVRKIQELHQQDCPRYEDFAILYRTNAQSRSLEDALRHEGIPYVIRGGLGFYQRKEIKDILAYFRLVINPDDEEAFVRVVNYPKRGIGDTTVNNVIVAAHTAGCSPWALMLDGGGGLKGAALNKLAAFRDLIATFQEKAQQLDAYELGKEIIKQSGISAELYSSNDPEYLSRQENLEEFLSGMQAFVAERTEEGRLEELSLADFMQEVALYSDQDRLSDEDDTVSLMTIHGAKGLEFPTVFVVGLEENIFPSLMSVDSPKKIEEERRLLYVAITRAERHCFLTSAENRFRYGQMQQDAPSRFLRDIDRSLLSTSDIATTQKRLMPWERGQHRSTYSDDWKSRASRYQNSRPVASQFMADPQPKVTATPRREAAVDPFTDSFKRKIQAAGGNLVRLEEAMKNGGRVAPDHVAKIGQLREGATIEHQRFGRGKVISLSGSGENAKAVVEFTNVGTKTLLLKFAKFVII